ncbi:unnamed protein product [Adineta steineri]|uniref:Uncharacterized protein n=1 Tax=Adineta steineri TaxID=433720 RepID=A0A818YMX9_9BILA|nr:unnamed protein product [Adineta steineri]CAF3758861.1 unnamed protein product [Adineta steineri]
MAMFRALLVLILLFSMNFHSTAAGPISYGVCMATCLIGGGIATLFGAPPVDGVCETFCGPLLSTPDP